MNDFGIKYGVDFINGKNESYKCYLGMTNVFIDTKFNWYTGCWVLPPVGNLRDEKVNDVVNRPLFRNRIKNMIEKKCPGCTCGFDENIEIKHLPEILVKKIFKG